MSGGTTTKGKSTTVGSISPALQGQFGKFTDAAFDVSELLKDIGPYRGRFIAKPTANQLTGLDWLDQLANSRQASGFGSNVINLANDTISGKYLDPKSNPAFQDYIKMGLAPFTEAFNEQIIPRIRSNAIAVGADLSPREGLVETQAAREVGRAMKDFETSLLFDVYRQERQNQLAGPALLGAGMDLEESPARLLGEVGDVQKQFAQEKLTNKILKHQEEIRAAMAPLQPLLSWAGVAPGFITDSTTKSEQKTKEEKDWMDYLGLVLSVVGIAAGA